MVSDTVAVLICIFLALFWHLYRRRVRSSQTSKTRLEMSMQSTMLSSRSPTPQHHQPCQPPAGPLGVQVVIRLLDLPGSTYEEGKAKLKTEMKGIARRSHYPVHIARVLQEDSEDSNEPTRAHVLGDGRLPDLRSNPPKSLHDFRELIAKLICLSCTGLDPDNNSLWCSHNWPVIMERTYKFAKLPVWWPEGADFKDPRKMKGSTQMVRRGLREAVIRCYHLFNSLDILDNNLREMASEVVPRVAPGELPLSTDMMKSFCAIYMSKPPAFGMD